MTQVESLYPSTDPAYWYARGVKDGREDVACALHELELFWDRSAEQIFRDRYAERMRLFAHRAQFLAEREGRAYREYFGGAVDWETGRPARRLVAVAA